MPLPGELPADSALDGMADVVVLVQIGSGQRLVVAGRGAQPEQCLAGNRPAKPTSIDELVQRLAAEESLPPRGVTMAK
jgi:hypothetical protein